MGQQMYPQIIYLYIMSFVMTIISIKLLIDIYKYVFKGITIIKVEKASVSKQLFVAKNLKKFNIVAIIIMFLWITISMYTNYRVLLDFNRVLNWKYETGNFVVKNGSYIDKGWSKRSVNLIEVDNNKELNLNLYYTEIYEGQCFKIIYFPNIHIGEIIDYCG